MAVGICLYGLIEWLAGDLKPQLRKSTEEPLIDAAHILAAWVASETPEGSTVPATTGLASALDSARHVPLSARIFDFVKTGVDTRIYVTDSRGLVLYDSDGRDEGRSPSL